MRFVAIALVATLATSSEAAVSQAEAESEFATGRAVPGLVDATRPIQIKDGALVCDDSNVLVRDGDLQAASGNFGAIATLMAKCINWHSERLVRVYPVMSDKNRYVMARQYGIVEFAVVLDSPNSSPATGFVRIVNLLDGQPLGALIPRIEVQVGDEATIDSARRLGDELARIGLKPLIRPSAGRFVVRVGPYSSRAEASKALEELKLTGFTAFIIEAE